ncbi:MAG: hypothetical protein AB2652_04800 [Candidatus Thiodiazotropha endolucinida]
MGKKVEVEAETIRKILGFFDRRIEKNPELIMPISKEELDEIDELVRDVERDT